MTAIVDAAKDFLACSRIAVTGVSKGPKGEAGNGVYRWLKKNGYQVGGSVSSKAAEYGRSHGITVIDGGCPLMFARNADPAHRLMCRWFTFTGNVPREV